MGPTGINSPHGLPVQFCFLYRIYRTSEEMSNDSGMVNPMPTIINAEPEHTEIVIAEVALRLLGCLAWGKKIAS